MDAIPLRCSSCGAPTRAGVAKCGHCGNQLATVVCPQCLGLMLQGARYCGACGASAIPWRTEPGGLTCPECSVQMSRGNIGGNFLHSCGSCSGTWIDTETFSRICRDTDRRTVLLGAPQIVGGANPPATIRLRYRKCPSCNQPMNRINFARCSGVIVDVCKPHGIWFDHSELQRILHFIQQGGLDKVRQLELEDLAQERRRVERLRADAMQQQPHWGVSHSTDFGSDLLIWIVVKAVGSILNELF